LIEGVYDSRGIACKLSRLAAKKSFNAHYDFVRIHRSCGCRLRMAAGVTDRLWSVENLIQAAFEARNESNASSLPVRLL
jgi:hypothetical protein